MSYKLCFFQYNRFPAFCQGRSLFSGVAQKPRVVFKVSLRRRSRSLPKFPLFKPLFHKKIFSYTTFGKSLLFLVHPTARREGISRRTNFRSHRSRCHVRAGNARFRIGGNHGNGQTVRPTFPAVCGNPTPCLKPLFFLSFPAFACGPDCTGTGSLTKTKKRLRRTLVQTQPLLGSLIKMLPQTEQKGCRLRSFKCEGEGVY